MELVNTGRRVQNPLQHKGFRRFQSCRHRPQQTRKCQVRTRLEISLRAIAHGFESHPLRQKKSSKLKGLLDFPFLHSSLNLSIFPVRTARFCVRTACFFSQKTGFKSGSVILPCSVTFSQRLPKSSDLGRSIPCSMACAEDILDL